METLRSLFHRKTPKEIIQENKRSIRQARREIEREKNRLNNEKSKSENEIRKLATKGEAVGFFFVFEFSFSRNLVLIFFQKALRIYAKNIVRQRNQLNKLGALDATLSTLESEASAMNAQMTMSSVMMKTTKALTRLNRMVPN